MPSNTYPESVLTTSLQQKLQLLSVIEYETRVRREQ